MTRQIIVNISTAALPAELQHPFYQYGVGFQFLHMCVLFPSSFFRICPPCSSSIPCTCFSICMSLLASFLTVTAENSQLHY